MISTDRLQELIDFESDRISALKIPNDDRTSEYRDNIGKLMRYMGKRDALTLVKAIMKGDYE